MNVAPANGNARGVTRKRKLLELAPLELECMTALWRMQEGTVRDIREALAARHPRAYTTIMTIMDRLAQKQIVLRRRAGRAWRYQPRLSKQEARSHALAQVIESFFGGSTEELLKHLSKPSTPAAALRPGDESV